MITKISTGIAGLDHMTYGGFVKGTNNLIVGKPGTGKSTIATQFLFEGLKNNEGAVYISLEEKKEKFMENMEQFGFRLREYEQKNIFRYVEVKPKEILVNIEEGIPTIENSVREVNAQRVVLDSITAFLLIFETEKQQRDLTKQLFDRIDRWNTTTVFISEIEEEDAKFGVDYLADSIIRLDLKLDTERKRGRVRTIEVFKMRGTNHRHTIVPFEINSEGVEVHPEAMIF